MNEVSASRVARAILDYLTENPSAQDTLAGITEWWLPGQGIRTQTTTVKDALALLIAEGLIVEVKGKDSQSHYRINEHK
jgi:Fe2+ or Zn2+ uptake regulation protein